MISKRNWPFLLLHKSTKEKDLDNKQDITIEILQNINNLKHLGQEIKFYHNRISELKERKSVLEQEVNSLR